MFILDRRYAPNGYQSTWMTSIYRRILAMCVARALFYHFYSLNCWLSMTIYNVTGECRLSHDHFTRVKCKIHTNKNENEERTNGAKICPKAAFYFSFCLHFIFVSFDFSFAENWIFFSAVLFCVAEIHSAVCKCEMVTVLLCMCRDDSHILIIRIHDVTMPQANHTDSISFDSPFFLHSIVLYLPL